MTPLAAIAIPAVTAAATQLVQEIAERRPFASFLSAATAAVTSHELPPLVPMEGLGELMGRLQTALADRLAAAGLDPATSFDLSVDTSGQVVVGDHPLREQIAAALAGDRTIRDTVAQISATSSMMAAAKRHLEFAKRYAIDPFTPLPVNNDPPFSLSFDRGQLLLGE